MANSRSLSMVAGMIIGVILGLWVHSMEIMVVKAETIAWQLAFYCGALPGLIIGFLGGAVTPFYLPRGHMSKSIGSLAYVFVTPLTWYAYWPRIWSASGLEIFGVIGLTVLVLLIILPVSDFIGHFFEGLREG